MSPGKRADLLLVERGLFESRAQAQAAIAAGRVTADGNPVRKPSAELSPEAVIAAAPAHPYVSRGGVKLAAALDHFGFDPAGHVCLDVGASTGGFCDVLLARGARRVYAVDVGRDQLHARLRERPELKSFAQTDIRKLDPAQLPESPDFCTVDVSFIALDRVLPSVDALLARPAWLIVLIKPQFEVGRARLRKGIVRDPALHAEVCAAAADLVGTLGWSVTGVVPSPIAGGDGNQEFLLGAARG